MNRFAVLRAAKRLDVRMGANRDRTRFRCRRCRSWVVGAVRVGSRKGGLCRCARWEWSR